MGLVYVTNQNSATVSVIETASDTIVATIKIPFAPQEIAITPDGSLAFVAVGFSNQVTVIDVASNQVVESIPFGSAGSLQSLAISTDGTRAYFAFAPHQILVMDTATRAVVSFVEIGPNGPPAIAVRPNDEAEQSCSNQ